MRQADGENIKTTLGDIMTVLVTPTDFNTIRTTGVYGIRFSPINYNGPVGAWGVLIVVMAQTGTYFQIYIPDGATLPFYKRGWANNAWVAWKPTTTGGGWTQIWTGKLYGRQTLSLNVSAYSKIKIYAFSYGATLIFEVDLTNTVPATAAGLSGYPYVGMCAGGQYTSANIWETHMITVGVNSGKNTIYNANMGFAAGTNYQLRNGTSYTTYYIYKIEGQY